MPTKGTEMQELSAIKRKLSSGVPQRPRVGIGLIVSNKFLTMSEVINKVALSFAVEESKQRKTAFTVLKKEI